MTQEDNQLRNKFKISFAWVKIICLILLVMSEYSFLTLPICLNDQGVASWIYPYTALGGTILVAFTYFVFLAKSPNCEVFLWTLIELGAAAILFTIMIFTCKMTFWHCARPDDWSYFLPEILGLLASAILLIHSLAWICIQRADEINNAVRNITV